MPSRSKRTCAAVAGSTKQACLDALRVIKVEAKELPFVVREDEAREQTSAKVWDNDSNVSKPRSKEQGDVEAGFGECATVVEGFYTTPVQLHHPLETHGNTISFTSTRDGNANLFDVPWQGGAQTNLTTDPATDKWSEGSPSKEDGSQSH